MFKSQLKENASSNAKEPRTVEARGGTSESVTKSKEKEEHMNTDIVKTAKDDENAELVKEVQNLIVKINNVNQNRSWPEYYVDLMSDDLLKRYGRSCLEEVTGLVLKQPSAAAELSERFTNILYEFNERYFGWLHFIRKVDVRYELADYVRKAPYIDKDGTLVLPAASEPVMVERLLGDMVLIGARCDCWECFMNESNRVFLAGAPMSANPNMRELSAEEFIAKATREPMTEEEHDAQLRQQSIAARQAKGPELN